MSSSFFFSLQQEHWIESKLAMHTYFKLSSKCYLICYFTRTRAEPIKRCYTPVNKNAYTVFVTRFARTKKQLATYKVKVDNTNALEQCPL